MPIQIKKPAFGKYDKKYRKSCVISMFTAILFVALLIILMGKITSDASKVASAVLFGAYLLFFASGFYSIFCGVRAYNKEDNVTDLFQCIFFLAAVVFCFMNLRMAVVLISTAFGFENLADTLKGSSLTYSEFVATQYDNWVCMIIGCVLSVVMGIFGAVKLISRHE
jgi:hypothetical protein